MYEELIKRLREDAEDGYLIQTRIGDDIAEAADAIEELQAQLLFSNDAARAIAEKVPKWIPVTKRLPKPKFVNEWYLVALESGCVESLGYRKGEGWFSTGSPVTHWMPLPEPPKEET